jgi:hypothetical protein
MFNLELNFLTYEIGLVNHHPLKASVKSVAQRKLSPSIHRLTLGMATEQLAISVV